MGKIIIIGAGLCVSPQAAGTILFLISRPVPPPVIPYIGSFIRPLKTIKKTEYKKNPEPFYRGLKKYKKY